MVYVILGMHKSGTSLVSELLHHAGIPMVEYAKNGDYETGNKWERTVTCSLNKRLLGGGDVNSLDLEPPPSCQLESEEARHAALGIIDSQGDDDWGFKDPRTCLTWPLWRTLLPEARIIGVYRHYLSVAARYVHATPRLQRVRPGWRHRVATLALHRWCEHNRVVLEAVRSAASRSMLVSYERLMEGREEIELLERFLGRPAPDRRRKSEQHGLRAAEVWVRGEARLEGGLEIDDPASVLDELEAWRTSGLQRAIDPDPT